MKLGLQINGFDWEGGPASFAAKLAEVARAAEEAGFDRIGVADHLWQHPIMGGPEANEPECYATLAFLAANTEGVGLTAMVSGVHFRPPALLAKTVTTLDVLSGGAPGWAWEQDTTRRRRGVSGSRFPRRSSATRCWRRRYRSV
jgi:alkanesulfonate monooxygenase SsuD/methylene tetrahydromethanopterin reductase-like flavin-dependent oxidoreductase (luciferase family)